MEPVWPADTRKRSSSTTSFFGKNFSLEMIQASDAAGKNPNLDSCGKRDEPSVLNEALRTYLSFQLNAALANQDSRAYAL